MIRFNSYPGLVVESAVRSLSHHILSGRMARDLTTDEYISYMQHVAVLGSKREDVDVLRYWATSMGKAGK